jgi:hypothetical protein
MGDRTRALECLDQKTCFCEPLPGFAGCASPSKCSSRAQQRHIGVSASQLPSRGELTDQTTARFQAASDLADSGGRIGHAMQTVETYAEIKQSVAKRHPFNVAFDDLDIALVLWTDTPSCPIQHCRRDINADIANPLTATKFAQRNPAATRHVENR